VTRRWRETDSNPRSPGAKGGSVRARAYARTAVRHRFKRRRDEWAETIGEWRDRTACVPRHTPAGRRIAICPATYSDASCKTCGACAHARDAVIGFPGHGAWRQVEAATAARDVAVGKPWTFRDHNGRGPRQRSSSLTPEPPDPRIGGFCVGARFGATEENVLNSPSAPEEPTARLLRLLSEPLGKLARGLFTSVVELAPSDRCTDGRASR
jgi:hypothetical protein